MAHDHSPHHDHPHGHGHAHAHGGTHGPGHSHHSHDPSAPHPAQPSPWSILRMSLPGRLAAAVAVAAGLWAVVLLAMRPS